MIEFDKLFSFPASEGSTLNNLFSDSIVTATILAVIVFIIIMLFVNTKKLPCLKLFVYIEIVCVVIVVTHASVLEASYTKKNAVTFEGGSDLLTRVDINLPEAEDKQVVEVEVDRGPDPVLKEIDELKNNIEDI